MLPSSLSSPTRAHAHRLNPHPSHVCTHVRAHHQNKRMLDKAIRELDRERMGLQNQEKKTIAEIKKMAKDNQMARTRRGQGACAGEAGRAAGSLRHPPLFGVTSVFASVWCEFMCAPAWQH